MTFELMSTRIYSPGRIKPVDHIQRVTLDERATPVMKKGEGVAFAAVMAGSKYHVLNI